MKPKLIFISIHLIFIHQIFTLIFISYHNYDNCFYRNYLPIQANFFLNQSGYLMLLYYGI